MTVGNEYPRHDSLAWQESAACADADPDLFFPDKTTDTRPAKAICAACPVRLACLDYAITADIDHGIWGGLSGKQRRRIRRTRRVA